MNELRLSLTKGSFKKTNLNIRIQTIDEAISLKVGASTQEKVYHTMYSFDKYDIKVGKPGKEFDNEEPKLNLNDMTPTVFHNGVILPRNGSFEEIFKDFVKIVPNYGALELLGCLIVRNSLCMDHKMNSGVWRYKPSINVVNQIQRYLPATFREPAIVFLYYMELIALNEDVKYSTFGYNISDGIGRYNNLMTYAHVISLILNRKNLNEADFLISLMEFAGGLVRPPLGLNPISMKQALISFPKLFT